ncbi:MAG: ABC transporter ATP-binding protein, partial [Bifidobacteriaceae bacterium]|nr:ABC transporter ATP-binding protein [Bifidobacteriaceae bacterium]
MLEIDGLTKRFGRHLALDAVSFQAQPGEVTAVVGPNGAGKTTLLSILVGVMKASAGRCEFRGMPQSEWSPARVGYLATDPFYYDKLTGIQMVSFERAMRRVDVSDRAVWELLEEFGATSFARRPMAELSQGMAKRIMLTCALMGEPRLVVLDEPLNALD